MLRNQAALRQQVASLQALQGSEAAHVKDLEEQVLHPFSSLCGLRVPVAEQTASVKSD